MVRIYYYFGVTGAGTSFKFKSKKILLKPPLGYFDIERVSFLRYYLSDKWIDTSINKKI